MKRDLDFIPKLLAEFEANDHYYIIVARGLNDSAEERKRQQHIDLMCDVGFVVFVKDAAYRMTSQGHDFLEASRNEGVWQETKNIVAETGGSVALEIVKKLALGLLKKKMKEHTDIEW